MAHGGFRMALGGFRLPDQAVEQAEDHFLGPEIERPALPRLPHHGIAHQAVSGEGGRRVLGEEGEVVWHTAETRREALPAGGDAGLDERLDPLFVHPRILLAPRSGTPVAAWVIRANSATPSRITSSVGRAKQSRIWLFAASGSQAHSGPGLKATPWASALAAKLRTSTWSGSLSQRKIPPCGR